MPTYLAIETATDICSVAVLKDDRVEIEISLGRPRAHSENLVLMIKDALNYAQVSARELAGIIVSKGPGSYTGLRIGVSAAKGLAYAHGIGLVGVPSLEALAHNALKHTGSGATIATAFNSRRNEVYLGLFKVTEDNSISALTPVASLQLDEISSFIEAAHTSAQFPRPLVIAGEGGAFVAAEMASLSGDGQPFNLEVLPATLVKPSAGTVATLGAARHKTAGPDDTADFEPFYLNEFIPKSRKKSIFDRLPF